MEPLEGFIKETDGIHFAFYEDFHDCHVQIGVEGTKLETEAIVQSSLVLGNGSQTSGV